MLLAEDAERRRTALETLSTLILQIYRAARDIPVDEFQDFVQGLIKEIVPFTSSRWLTVELLNTGALTHCSHLFNEPTDIVVDWDAINRMDRLMHTVIKNPGKAVGIHTPSFFAGREFAEIRDYTRRYRHANSLCISELGTTPKFQHAITLFREKDGDHFNDDNERLLEQLFPHMLEALTQNRLLSLRQTGIEEASTEQTTRAIARQDGQLYYAGSGFNALLRQEWPDWKGIKLPDKLLNAINKPGGTAVFSGIASCVSATCVGQLLFLRASACSALTPLSPRELSVAMHYGQGRSYKEIAKDLSISPATVRNFIQRIFTKLNITDKAELATMMSHNH